MAGMPMNLPAIPSAGAPAAAGGVPPSPVAARPPMPMPAPGAPSPMGMPESILSQLPPSMLLIFMAGMGMKPLAEAFKAAEPKKPGLAKDAKNAPTQQINPMLAQIIAQRAAQGGGTPGLPPVTPALPPAGV